MERVPLFPLSVVLLPRMPLPLHIFEERYRLMFEHCIREGQPFGVILRTGNTNRNAGCLAQIEDVINRYDDGRLDVICTGTDRFTVNAVFDEKPYMEADVEVFHDADFEKAQQDALEKLARDAIGALQDFARISGYTLESDMLERLNFEQLSFLMATTDVFSVEEKQELLELRCTATRIQRAANALSAGRQRRSMIKRIREVLGKQADEDLSHFFN